MANIAQIGAKLVRMMLAAIQAVNAVTSRGWIVETAQYPAQGRFARRDPTNQTYPLTRVDSQVDISQRFATDFRIAETDMFESKARFANFGRD